MKMRRPQSDIQRILGYTRKGCRLKKDRRRKVSEQRKVQKIHYRNA